MDSRLYIELVPDDSALERLHALTSEIKPLLKGRPVDSSKWHVTILHFGVAEHAFHDIRRVLPNLTNRVFEENLTTYIESAQGSLPAPTSLIPTKLGIFGINQSALALEFEPNDEIISAHDQALHDLTNFLKGCGVIEAEEFMRSSINFKWALELKPHLTLFRGLTGTPDTSSIVIDQSPMHFSSASLHGL